MKSPFQQKRSGVCTTPLRCGGSIVPRMSPSPFVQRRGDGVGIRNNGTLRRSRGGRVSNSCGGDRYIPNRRRIDFSSPQVKANFYHRRGADEEKKSQRGDLPESYKQQLRRALFCNDSNDSTSILGLTKSSTAFVSANSTPSSKTVDPYLQDVLRSFHTTSSSLLVNRRCRRHSGRSTSSTDNCAYICSAPDNVVSEEEASPPPISVNENLNLISTAFGPGRPGGENLRDTVCCALGNEVLTFSGRPGSKMEDDYEYCRPFGADDFGGVISSVRCNKTDPLLPFFAGGKGKVKLGFATTPCSTLRDMSIDVVADMPHNEFITALDFVTIGNKDAFAAASRIGIQIPFDGHGGTEIRFRDPGEVSNLKYHKASSTLACALKDHVTVWDLRNTRDYLYKLEQEMARGLEYCPMDPNILATGGQDGIKLWDVKTGTLKTAISIPNKTVNSLLWSPYCREVLASYDHCLSLWSTDLVSGGGNAQHLKEWEIIPEQADDPIRSRGTILTMDHLSEGKVVTVDGHGWFFECQAFRDPFESITKKKRCSQLDNQWLSDSPVIR